MTFGEFVRNIRLAESRGSFALTLIYMFSLAMLFLVLVGLIMLAPVVGISAMILTAVVRLIWAGFTGR